MVLLYAELLKKAGKPYSIVDMENLPTDMAFYFGEATDGNHPFEAVRQQLIDATHFVFIVPEYNGSFPGILKLLIDNSKYPESFRGKKCAMVGLSAGMFGNLRGLDHLSGVLNYLQASILPYRVHLAKLPYGESDPEKILTDDHRKQIQNQVDLFLEF